MQHLGTRTRTGWLGVRLDKCVRVEQHIYL